MITNRQPTDRASIAVGLLVLVAGTVLLGARLVFLLFTRWVFKRLEPNFAKVI